MEEKTPEPAPIDPPAPEVAAAPSEPKKADAPKESKDTADTAFRGVDARLKAVEAKLEVKAPEKRGVMARLEAWLESDL